MGRVRFTSRIREWTGETEAKLDLAVLEMATDIHRVASVFAPKLTRNLVNSGRIKRNGKANYSVIFGGNAGGFNVPYARIRHFENKLHPGTLRYLERAGDSTSRNAKRYLKDVI